MLILRKNILLDNNQDEPQFNIVLSNHDTMIDTENQYEVDFDGIINSRINEPVDNEIKQFKYLIGENNEVVYFYFNSLKPENVSPYTPYQYLNIGFTQSEIDSYLTNEVMLNSFYIIEVYDSKSLNSKRLLTRSYSPIISKQSLFTLNNRNQFSKINIPKWFINEKLDLNTDESVKLYMWISFYNAKTGKISVFKNTSQNKEFFVLDLNIRGDNKNTWKFDYPLGLLIATEDNKNIGYINKINNNVNNLEIKKPNYPKNKYFDRQSIKYDDLI